MSQFTKMFEHVLWGFETRVERLGLSTKPLSELGTAEKLALIAEIGPRKARAKLRGHDKLLTSTYLEDPLLAAETERFS
jgi:hypothetical protein